MALSVQRDGEGLDFSVVLEEKEGETRPASWQALSEYDVSVQCDDTGYGTRLTVRLSRESTDSFT